MWESWALRWVKEMGAHGEHSRTSHPEALTCELLMEYAEPSVC